MKRTTTFLLLILISLASVINLNAQTYQHLKLTSMCTDDPSTSLRWRVQNLNNYAVTYTWKIVDGGNNAPKSSQYPGPFIAQPGYNYFYSPKWHSGNNVMVIYVNNVEQNGGRKAAGNSSCNTFNIFAECVKQVDACTYLATFGYENLNSSAFTIYHGNDNKITGATVFRGETDTVYYPGMHHNAFKIRFSCPGNIVWHLKGPFGNKSVNTSSNATGTCVDAVKIYVKHIYLLSQGNHRAVFGYTNEGNDTVSINDASRNYLTGTILQGNTPIDFYPGSHDSAFYVDFSGSKLKWNLTGYDEVERYAYADTLYTNMNLKSIRIFVNCVKKLSNNNSLAVFGYENSGNSTIAINKGSRNRLIYENTGNLPLTVFLPGKVDSAFSSTFSGDEMKWALISPDGIEHFAVADEDYCKKCNEHCSNQHRFVLSPNPVSNEINLQPLFSSVDIPDQSEVSVYDISGNKIKSLILNINMNERIDLSSLVKGIYFIQISNPDFNQMERIVKL